MDDGINNTWKNGASKTHHIEKLEKTVRSRFACFLTPSTTFLVSSTSVVGDTTYAVASDCCLGS